MLINLVLHTELSYPAHHAQSTFTSSSSAHRTGRWFHPKHASHTKHWSFFVGIATNLLRAPSSYDMAWISRNNSTHALIPVACQFVQAGVGAGFTAPALGVDQCSSSSAEQLSDNKMGFAWKPLQHTPMTWTERVFKLLSPSFRLLPSPLTLIRNWEHTQSHVLSKVNR